MAVWTKEAALPTGSSFGESYVVQQNDYIAPHYFSGGSIDMELSNAWTEDAGATSTWELV